MPSKTFIVISLSDRVNDLNNLIDSINRYDRFKDYDVNLIYQDFLGNRDKIRNKERFRKIYYYDQKLGCHGARGAHSVTGMSDLVYKMLKDGWSDVQICNELGMEADELIRLKYITGFAKLYEKKEYNLAWTPANVTEADFADDEAEEQDSENDEI